MPKLRGGWVEGLRALLNARERCVGACVSARNAALAVARCAPEAERRRWEGLSQAEMMRGCAALPERDATPVERALLALGRTWEAARAEADALEGAMEAMVAANLPSLAAVPNCGAVSAAKLVVAAGENPGRLRSEGAFAMLCGAAPVPASSGKTDRFRLNRGGDRRANNALHMIVAGRMRSDPRTAEYVERRRAEGKSTREIMRCLKRYVAREVYRALTRPGDAPAPPDPAALRAARRSAGLSQRQVAEALGLSQSSVSGAERGVWSNRLAAARYARWVEDGMPMDVAVG